MKLVLTPAPLLLALLAAPATLHAQTPAEAYARGCARCHSDEASVLRKIPRLPDEARKAWIGQFLAGHPYKADGFDPLIRDYLMEKTAR